MDQQLSIELDVTDDECMDIEKFEHIVIALASTYMLEAKMVTTDGPAGHPVFMFTGAVDNLRRYIKGAYLADNGATPEDVDFYIFGDSVNTR
jgi:hypothetical protein